MSILVQISGKPATGKTTGARTLNPKTTYIIDSDEKGLPWKGWAKDYNSENKNYVKTSDPSQIYKIVKAVHDSRPEVNCLIIDTINTVMSNEEMAILKDPSRDAWKDLAVDIYDLYKLIRQLPREDLIVFVMAHIEPYDVNGVTNYRTMTNGKKLSKLNLNSHLRYNLYTEVVHNPIKEVNEYSLITQSDGTTEARSVMGVFESKRIPNDLEQVRLLIQEGEK